MQVHFLYNNGKWVVTGAEYKLVSSFDHWQPVANFFAHPVRTTIERVVQDETI